MADEDQRRVALEKLAASIAQSLELADRADQPLIGAMLAHCLDICQSAIRASE